MKKILSFALALAALGMIASCGSQTASPGAAAKQYMEAMAHGNFEKFVNGIHYDEDLSADELAQAKAMWTSLASEKGKKAIDDKGGLKSIEIVSEEISEDGQTATVVLRQTFGNGEAEEDDTDMVLVNGKWLMSTDK